MSQLATIPSNLVANSKYATDLAHKQVSGKTWLPRIQLLQASSNLCKKGKVPIGTYAVLRSKDTVVHQLGDVFDAFVAGWRPKAVRFKNVPKPQVFYNPAHPEFKKIQHVESQVKNSGSLFGPEYLLYIPSANELGTFHFNNATLQQSAAGMIGNIGKAVTFKVDFIEKNGNSWHGPVILNCSTPLSFPNDEAFLETYNEELHKFANPPEVEEEVEEAAPEVSSRAH